MPWFQPTKTPPMASVYRTNDNDNDNDNNNININISNNDEYEFGEDNSNRRRNNNTNNHNSDPTAAVPATATEALLEDSLSRRMLSLMSPLMNSSSSTIPLNHVAISMGMDLKQKQQQQQQQQQQMARSSSSSSPSSHPTYQYRDVSLPSSTHYDNGYGHAHGHGHGYGHGNDDDDRQTFGYEEHASFFHPRRIHADAPFVHPHGHPHGHHAHHAHMYQGGVGGNMDMDMDGIRHSMDSRSMNGDYMNMNNGNNNGIDHQQHCHQQHYNQQQHSWNEWDPQSQVASTYTNNITTSNSSSSTSRRRLRRQDYNPNSNSGAPGGGAPGGGAPGGDGENESSSFSYYNGSNNDHRHEYDHDHDNGNENDNDNNPQHRFGFSYDDDPTELKLSKKEQKKRRRQQQKLLIRNQTNGELDTTDGQDGQDTSQQHGHGQGQGHGWAQVGQIASYHSSKDQERAAANTNANAMAVQEQDQAQQNSGKSSKKRKKKKKEKDKQKRPVPDIRAMMGGDNADGNTLVGEQHAQHDKDDDDVDVDVDDSGDFQNKAKATTKKKKSGNTRTKKRKATSTTSTTTIPSKQNIPVSMETIQSFAEMHHVKNAGSSTEALAAFLQMIKQSKQQKTYITWTMIFHDSTCSTPFLPCTKKYCTPKGPPCTMWNCTCDNQIRAMQASKPVVGAMFVFPMNVNSSQESQESESLDTDSAHSSLDCFLLPLCPTVDPEVGTGPKDIDAGYERMAHFPFLPILCDTSLQARWDTFRSILIDRHVIKVTFNAQVGLMPYHYHCANDIAATPTSTGSDKHENESNSTNRNQNHYSGYLDMVLPNIWDLRLASWILSPHAEEETLEMENKKAGFSHLYPKPKCPIPPNATPHLTGLIEAKEQLEFLYALYPIVDGLLESNGLKHSFCEIESPVQSVLSAMECFGIGFKPDQLIRIQKQLEDTIDNLNQEARELTKDCDFMLSSPQQVASFLFDKMGLNAPERTRATATAKARPGNSKGQHRSTSEESLKAIQNEYKKKNGESLRIVELILTFRGLNKVLSTYIRPYPKLARDDNSNLIHSRKATKTRSKKKSKISNSSTTRTTAKIKKIHPMWMQTAVRTGRLSCRKPNLQQVPTGSVLGVCPRSAFTTSAKDSCLFACDYSQKEVRILAHMSGDANLMNLFTQPGTDDVYKQMSSVISGKRSNEVTDKERSIAKQLTLAIMYGMGINSVAKQLGVNKESAKSFFRSFYGRFPDVKRWMDQTISSARTNKYVTTISGRRRYLDNITNEDRALRSQAERQAINTIIQGSAADLMKLAMLKMASRITDWRKERTGNGESNTPPRMLLQIHDELLFEIVANQADVDRLRSVVTRCCTEECVEEFRLKVPLKLKCSIGTSWGSMKEL
uniref:DNA-directed DNA polymerase n=1 Tax=Chaetoceros debilis TaxID=122233 RepID=A0A7S3V8E1_9STRA